MNENKKLYRIGVGRDTAKANTARRTRARHEDWGQVRARTRQGKDNDNDKDKTGAILCNSFKMVFGDVEKPCVHNMYWIKSPASDEQGTLWHWHSH
jgi:hypothetical protein